MALSSSQKEGKYHGLLVVPRKPRISSTDRQHTPDSGQSSSHSALAHSLSQYHHSPLTTKPHTALLHPTLVRRSRHGPLACSNAPGIQSRSASRSGVAAPAVSWAERWLAETSPCRYGNRLGYTASGGVYRQRPEAVEDGQGRRHALMSTTYSLSWK